MPGYAVEGLSVAFRLPDGEAVQALQDVSFRVAPGELLVVLGQTGAGKTTLLRTLAGLEKPAAGRIAEVSEDGAEGADRPAGRTEGHAEGRRTDITSLEPHRRDMAMVFQNFSLYPRMKVGENLAFPLRSKALGMPEGEIATRVKEAAAFLGLADKLDRMPTELSGGEMQRVALGRALVRRPKLFLLDEPLANLDAKLRERMVVEIRRLQRALGAAMLYVTHDHAEAMGLADRILVLHQGRILQAGPPEEIYAHPVDSRVARMLGRPAVNIFAADAAARLGLSDAKGKVVGVRPESWKVTPDAQGPALVKVTEHLGPRMALLLDVQGIPLRALAAPNLRLRAGDRVRLGVDPADILLFDR
jgi:multiple sugar transport system ATP-binding protein